MCSLLLGASLVFTWRNVAISPEQPTSVISELWNNGVERMSPTLGDNYTIGTVWSQWDFWLLRRMEKRDTMQGIGLWNWSYIEGIYRIRETCKNGEKKKRFWFQMFKEGDILAQAKGKQKKSFAVWAESTFSLYFPSYQSAVAHQSGGENWIMCLLPPGASCESLTGTL